MSTDSAIEHYLSLGASIASRQKLHVSKSLFSDVDSQQLLALPDLRHLVLNATDITDASLNQINRLEHLEILDLSESSISDAIIPILGHLKQLRVLGLYATQITDSTMESISELPSLEMLNISLNPQITDVGFQQLAKLKRLKSIEIHGTNISADAVNDFSIQYPDVIIVTDAGVVRGNA